MRLTLILLLSLLAACNPEPAKLCGLNVLSTRGTIDNIRDYDFVSGYTLRLRWDQIEVGPELYDWSVIDAALAREAELGQRLVLEIFATAVPAHVLRSLGSTWNTAQGDTAGLPWDRNQMEAWRSFVAVLSARYANNPALAGIDAPIVGMQSIRDQSGALTARDDFDPVVFKSAVLESVHIVRDAFPVQQVFVGFFGMGQNPREPDPLGDDIAAALVAEFPGIGLFQELLSDAGPDPLGIGRILAQYQSTNPVLFQALEPWTKPFVGRESKVASGSPITGLALAAGTYNSRYVELYVEDIDNQAFWPDLRAWSAAACQ